MKLVPLFTILAALALAGCQTTPKAPASDLHAFVLEAREAYGPNRDQWPLEVQREFDHRFQEQLSEE